MRIALFHNLPSGGAKRHTFEQVKRLAQRGHTLLEFVPSTAALDYCSFAPFVERQKIYPFSPKNASQRRIPMVTPYLNAFNGIERLEQVNRLNQQITDEIDADNFDLVFAKDCHFIMNPYLLQHVQTPSVFQCHHGLRHRQEEAQPGDAEPITWTDKFKELYYAPAKSIFNRKFQADEINNIQSASKVITNSKFSEQLILEHYQVSSSVVYPGINTDLFQPLPVDKQNYVLSVGSLIYTKGYRFLVSAIAQIAPSRRPKLFIAANSHHPQELQAIKKQAHAQGVTLHIEQIMDDQRLVQVYNQAQVFVYAPIQEALGMAPLEALACGTPVVAVAEGGVKETVTHGVTGWTVARDVTLFAESLDHLLTHQAEQQRMGQAGIDYVRKHWTWEKAIDQLEVHFQTVCRPIAQYNEMAT